VPDQRHWLGVIAQMEMGALIHATARRLRTVPPTRYERELSWAGRTYPSWPKRNDRPDYAALRTVRRGVRQAI